MDERESEEVRKVANMYESLLEDTMAAAAAASSMCIQSLVHRIGLVGGDIWLLASIFGPVFSFWAHRMSSRIT